MPIYEYRCKKNGHHFEVIQKISDPPLKTCIHCRSKVEKLISASAFVLKGSGFYVNDYAKKGSGDSGEKGGKGEKAASGGSSSDKSSGGDSGSKESKEPAASSGSDSSSKKPAKESSGGSSTATVGS